MSSIILPGQLPAADLLPIYSIEMNLELSSLRKVKCGAIFVFGQPDYDLDQFRAETHPEAVKEMQEQINRETQILRYEPEYFRESDGKWLPWAIERMFHYYDLCNSNAMFVINSSRLGVHAKIARATIAAQRSNPEQLFRAAFQIDKLLSLNFNFDPWTSVIRRGTINAEMKNR